jgi:hypothetical protein
MRIRLMVGSLLMGVSLAVGGVPVAAHEGLRLANAEPRPDTRVVIAEDKTVEAECVQAVQIKNRPMHEGPCMPGSVVFTRETTYAEAKTAGISDYVILTGDVEQDRKLTHELAEKVHVEKSGDRVHTRACWWGPGNMSGSYKIIPDDPNSARMQYEVQYDHQGCQIGNIRDRSAMNAGQLNWEQTCTLLGPNNCKLRNILVGVAWTGWQAALNSAQGQRYTHISSAPCWNCGRPYGFQDFP